VHIAAQGADPGRFVAVAVDIVRAVGQGLAHAFDLVIVVDHAAAQVEGTVVQNIPVEQDVDRLERGFEPVVDRADALVAFVAVAVDAETPVQGAFHRHHQVHAGAGAADIGGHGELGEGRGGEQQRRCQGGGKFLDRHQVSSRGKIGMARIVNRLRQACHGRFAAGLGRFVGANRLLSDSLPGAQGRLLCFIQVN
jgi:hypothetical protein